MINIKTHANNEIPAKIKIHYPILEANTKHFVVLISLPVPVLLITALWLRSEAFFYNSMRGQFVKLGMC